MSIEKSIETQVLSQRNRGKLGNGGCHKNAIVKWHRKNRGYGHSTLMGLRRYITGIWIPTCGLMTILFYGTINNMRPWYISWKERFQWRNMWISNAASRILSMTQPIFGDTLVDGTNPKQIETVEIQPLEASALVAFQKHGRNTGLKGAFEAHFQSASRTK